MTNPKMKLSIKNGIFAVQSTLAITGATQGTSREKMCQ